MMIRCRREIRIIVHSYPSGVVSSSFGSYFKWLILVANHLVKVLHLLGCGAWDEGGRNHEWLLLLFCLLKFCGVHRTSENGALALGQHRSEVIHK